MNQRDYKAIAKIIENQLIDSLFSNDEIYVTALKNIASDLADYFTEEYGTVKAVNEGKFFGVLARKQFLRDCGVDGFGVK